jgi:thymidylate synthase
VIAIDIRVYLIGYIFCIIDYHIYRNIFDRIDIMYYKVSYVSGCVLPLKTFVLYIYISVERHNAI